MATSRIADSVGRVLGDRYRLLRPIGVGASAHVYAAEDVRLKRRVAVKVLHPALAGEEAFLRRFRRESQAVASLRHPNILRVYDWGQDDGSPYLVMELLEGGSLRSMLDRGARLSPAQAAAIGADTARALDYAHRQGIVHRDIKPANLIFDDEGRVSVADFGLARALAEATWTEPAGAVVGTARYASPELVRGEHLDSKADVYSLALVLIEAITGDVPFVADTPFGTLMARVGRPLEVSEETGPLKPILEAAGAVDTAARTDAAALARALDAVAVKLPFPAPLSLAPPLITGLVERDESSPTEYPGRPRLFDRAEWDDEDRVEEGVGSAGGTAARSGPGDGAPQVIRLERRSRRNPGAPPDRPDRGGGEEGPRPRRRLRRSIVALLLAMILAAAAVAAWGLASGTFTPDETVPAVTGQSQTVAASTLSRVHLGLQVTGHSYSPSVAAGRVLSQLTPAGSRVKRGRRVRVILSDGPRPVAVPLLRGVPLATAEQDLSGLGLKWTRTDSTSLTVPAQSVISSSPDSGTLVPGQSVALVVSTGKPKVPVPPIALQTETYTAARAALQKAGFSVAPTDSYENTIAAGMVVSVSPASGTEVTVGSTVTVVVSKGPHYVAVPGVSGDSVGAASEALGALGFNVAGVQGNPVDTVTGTSPAGGTEALYGASVTLITG